MARQKAPKTTALEKVLAAGRKATASLYVMLEPDELERYKRLAEGMGLSMRDLVRMGLDQIASEQASAGLDAVQPPPSNDLGGGATLAAYERRRLESIREASDPLRKIVLAQGERLTRLEEQLARLKSVVDGVT